MQRAIDGNKFSIIRRLTPSLEDLFYAFNKNKLEAVFIIFQNQEIKQALYNSCVNLTFEEKRFLLGGTNPKDIANVIGRLKTD
jgi:hypothetical protein